MTALYNQKCSSRTISKRKFFGVELKRIFWFYYLLGFESLVFSIGNLFWRPFSSDLQLFRIGQAANFIFLFLLVIFIIFGVFAQKNGLANTFSKRFPWFKSRLYTISGVLTGFTIVGGVVIVCAYSPLVYNALGLMGMIFRQTMWIWLFIGITSLQILFALICKDSDFRAGWHIGKWKNLSACALTLAIYFVVGFVVALLLKVSFVRVIATFQLLILLAILSGVWYWGYLGSKYRETLKWENIKPIQRFIMIFVIAFLFYQLTAILIGNVNTPSKAYFDELARAFLQGKLYLENPTSTHDLTFFNGKWYLPFPPLAALIMVPLVKIYGDVGFSTVTFTIFFAALNCALLYELVRVLSLKRWIAIEGKQLYWVVLCFALGTPFWYIAVVGKVWYIERILALTFMLCAVCFSLKRYSPIVIGIAIGLSIWSRPNGVFIWPLFVGIFLQNKKEEGNLTLRALCKWILLNAIPIIIAVLVLLFYNRTRFGNWFDFGYQNQNVGENAANVISEGFFNLKVIPRNIFRMLISLPLFEKSCKWFFVPNHLGMSIFLTTPSFIFLFKAFQKNIFAVSVWIALLFEILLLWMQNGINWEFGYSYILDIIIPLIILMCIGLGQRISILTKILIFIGIGINFWGLLWYFGFYCPVL